MDCVNSKATGKMSESITKTSERLFNALFRGFPNQLGVIITMTDYFNFHSSEELVIPLQNA